MDIFGKPNRAKTPAPVRTRTEPQLTDDNAPSIRTYAPPPAAHTYGELAAMAKQREEDRENHIHALEEKLRKSENRNDLVEEANKMLHEDMTRLKLEHKVDNDTLRRERDYYYECFLKMRTRLVCMAEINADGLAESQDVRPLKGYPEEPADLSEADDRRIDKFRPPGHRKYAAESPADSEAGKTNRNDETPL